MNKNCDHTQLSSEFPPASESGLFGLESSQEDSKVCIIPVPWDATASYGKGASLSSEGIVKASHQLDLFDLSYGSPYKQGIHMLRASADIKALNEETSKIVSSSREKVDSSQSCEEETHQVNAKSLEVNKIVYDTSLKLLEAQKLVGVLGGDHSSPFGLIRALSSVHENFGILHIDAHFDLRRAYEGFEHSHASIMFNVLEHFKQVSNIVHVGIRDFCEDEKSYSMKNSKRSKAFYDFDIFSSKASGTCYKDIARSIVDSLPEKVYVSFDIDGLNPMFCPGTGTPVPGGLDFNEAIFILEYLAKSGKKVIGFDLCEVANPLNSNEWDFNVGARILYKLCGTMLYSNQESNLQ